VSKRRSTVSLHRHKSDQETEYAAFYGTTPARFPAGYQIGARVRGSGLGEHEHAGPGVVIERSADGERVRVLYDDGSELDAYLGDVALEAKR
jgi:hypothetical protein